MPNLTPAVDFSFNLSPDDLQKLEMVSLKTGLSKDALILNALMAFSGASLGLIQGASVAVASFLQSTSIPPV